MFYKEVELKCTEQELQNFIKSIQITSEIRDFSQKYNNVNIENPTGQENAKYYILNINGTTVMQNFVPSEQGFIPITVENAQSVIDKHKQQIIDNMIISKFRITEESKIDGKITELQQSIADLSMLIATPQTT